MRAALLFVSLLAAAAAGAQTLTPPACPSTHYLCSATACCPR